MDKDQIADELRLRILDILNETPSKRASLQAALGDAIDDAIPEIEYLKFHGLIDVDISVYMDGEVDITPAKITPKGRDFLHKGRSIGSQLNVVTVRLHEDTIRDLLVAQVRASDAEDSVKAKLVDQLKALPAEAVSKLAEKALEKALHYMPNAIQWLQTAPWN